MTVGRGLRFPEGVWEWLPVPVPEQEQDKLIISFENVKDLPLHGPCDHVTVFVELPLPITDSVGDTHIHTHTHTNDCCLQAEVGWYG